MQRDKSLSQGFMGQAIEKRHIVYDSADGSEKGKYKDMAVAYLGLDSDLPMCSNSGTPLALLQLSKIRGYGRGQI